MCVKYRLINAQLITALISHLFVAMNAIQMYLLGGVEYQNFCPFHYRCYEFFKTLFSKTQQISTLLHSMKDN